MIGPLEMMGEAKTVTIKEIEMMIGEVEMMIGEVEIMMIEGEKIMMIEGEKIMMIEEVEILMIEEARTTMIEEARTTMIEEARTTMIEEARTMMIEEARTMMIEEAGTITTEKETEITMKQEIRTKRDLLVQVVRGGGVEPRRREGGGVYLQSINLQREGADQERGRGNSIIHLVREIGAVADLVSDQGDRSAWNRTVNKTFFKQLLNFC